MRKNVDGKRIKRFGRRLAELRINNNMTQEDLAFKCEMSLSQIARIETGVINTTLNTILLLADALDIHPKELMDF